MWPRSALCSPRGGPRVRPARAAYGDRAGSWLRERWKSPYVEMDRYSCTGRYATGWLRRMHSEGVMPTRDLPEHNARRASGGRQCMDPWLERASE